MADFAPEYRRRPR